ncbi:hypothetical protein BofuT4_P004100.1 [Botrytis cinerea T4]|uniref:Uncharacterized protein n=1 Tax=Botryotinia fuckeliana (strain T4) TaxID=999810 RepID=G2Y3L1_BOTF4|nr:hypothetical protein BofuT4_P004100.1 [Botrytis cinerea T4]
MSKFGSILYELRFSTNEEATTAHAAYTGLVCIYKWLSLDHEPERGEGDMERKIAMEIEMLLILRVVRCVETSYIRSNEMPTACQLLELGHEVALIIIHSILKTGKEKTPGPEHDVIE